MNSRNSTYLVDLIQKHDAHLSTIHHVISVLKELSYDTFNVLANVTSLGESGTITDGKWNVQALRYRLRKSSYNGCKRQHSVLSLHTPGPLQTNVSTCVQGSPHLGQVRVLFFPPPVPLLDDPFDEMVSFEGGVGSVGALPKLPLIVKPLLATTTLTILCTVPSQTDTKYDLIRSPRMCSVSCVTYMMYNFIFVL
ncbi:hypothetical protein ALC62_07149 [Cyphomyrmex costatus]|uniref:Uncharacterized protein n=1 Tax=Cyphomyrmex costatus TaxID=456900 RepID=A0A151IHZ2_9HYME|nr:hypothetical protein ALC62_07149 [Cyphomyrmex costatus]